MISCNSVISSVVVLVVAGAWIVDGNDSSTKQRVDAAQENFESVNLLIPNAPKSSLFDSCLLTSTEGEIKLFSIEIPSTTHEFVRHVPDASLGVLFRVVNSTVGNIFDCASAADASGYKMFKYKGPGECSVSSFVYNLTAAPNCTEEEHDAVFVLSSANVSLPCQPPRILSGFQPDGVTVNCILIASGSAGNPILPTGICRSKGMDLFQPLPGTSHADVAAMLTAMGRTEKFRVGYYHSGDGPWLWGPFGVLVESEAVPGLNVTDNQNGAVDLMYLDPDHGFLVNFTHHDTYLVTLCIQKYSV